MTNAENLRGNRDPIDWVQPPMNVADPQPHLDLHLQRDLDALRARVGEMGRLASRALERATRALREADTTEAEAVILRDHLLNRIEAELERAGLELIIRHRPSGRPLRLAYASIRIANILERIGDCGESVARQTLQLTRLDPRPALPRFEEQTALALGMLDQALKAYQTDDEALASRTIPVENTADQLRDQIREELLRRQGEGALSGTALNLLLTVARRLERVTDQARTICEEILFVSTGQPARQLYAGPIRILFVDDTHACLGHLAEAVGRQIADDGFQFSSAGVHPVPPHPSTREFLVRKGVDVSRLVSRSLGQVAPPEEHHAVISLTTTARQVFPMPSTPTLCLEWPMTDPTTFPNPAATLEAAWLGLEQRLRPLIEAVIRE